MPAPSQLHNSLFSFFLRTALLHETKAEYTEKIEKLTAEVYEQIDLYKEEIIKYRMIHYNTKLQDPINFNSNDQLAILLYDIIGAINTDKEKPRGVGEDALKKIDLPLTKAIKDYMLNLIKMEQIQEDLVLQIQTYKIYQHQQE